MHVNDFHATRLHLFGLDHDDPDLFFVGRADGDIIGVTITNTLPANEIVLQFFAIQNGDAYGSPLVTCVFGNSYAQGLCDGADSPTGIPDLSTVIYGLSHLFQGGPAPPCRVACDVNGDGSFDLSDMIFLLGFLFQGSAAPPLWTDQDGDMDVDPTCIRAGPEDSCATSHSFCE